MSQRARPFRAPPSPPPRRGHRIRLPEHIVEIVSDSGEGAQKAGQTLGTISAKMGNGVWTVEIIPAEIKPPARSRGRRQRHPRPRSARTASPTWATRPTWWWPSTSRCSTAASSRAPTSAGTVILLENRWATDPGEDVRRHYADGARRASPSAASGSSSCRSPPPPTRSPPTSASARTCSSSACSARSTTATSSWPRRRCAFVFGKKGAAVVAGQPAADRRRLRLRRAEHVDLAFEIPPRPRTGAQVVMNGNQAVGLGVLASGMEVVAMYPITPATSVSHYLVGRAAAAWAASSTRPRTRSPPSASPSAPATPARPPARSPRGRAWR